MVYLTTHSTHFYFKVIYDLRVRVRVEPTASPGPLLLFPISNRVLLYTSSNRQDNTYHGLCYHSRGALAGTRNS